MTATEVMVTVTAMLKAVNLQVFELGMWQAWSGEDEGLRAIPIRSVILRRPRIARPSKGDGQCP